MKTILILTMLFFATLTFSQTMIEMAHPADADIVLIEVKDTADADVIIYLTDEKEEIETWDCMWKTKAWGFSNFSFYLAKSETDSLLITDDGKPILISGKIYFTKNKELRGYKNDKVHLDGVMRVKRNK